MSLQYDKNNEIEVVVVSESEIPDATPEQKITLTDREKDKFIKKVEKIVRISGEYRDCTAFLRQYIGMDKCAFFNNISKATNKKIKIEIHHEPLTLYDICDIIVTKWMAAGQVLNDLLVAEEVAELHYEDQVGLIPLSKTLHEVVHNSDKLVIPMYMIYGDYLKFLKENEDYWVDNKRIKKKIERMIQQTKELTDKSFDALDVKFTYIKCDGFEMPVKILDEEEVKTEVDKKKVETKKAA